ncbi:hypothetical protein J8M97_18640 [Gordonia polyisoprenivorans]|uniref:hypothetical protein n=1 Tax=Gordonia polyisoprenivorans TaxID=84595 RepID=UPI001B8CBC29|nr:hypothetical protein [Gordonia polyisoprenivorans]QUD81764.1 hypothetical protein J8M97_18640 [Gordonia polyisoprenivorans]UZF57450.1 hypothetical protein LH935_05495 [Gordonia polyisoprenivorans]
MPGVVAEPARLTPVADSARHLADSALPTADSARHLADSALPTTDSARHLTDSARFGGW